MHKKGKQAKARRTQRGQAVGEIRMDIVCEACGCSYNPWLHMCPKCGRAQTQYTDTARLGGIIEAFQEIVDSSNFGDALAGVFMNETPHSRDLARSLGVPYLALVLLYQRTFAAPLVTVADINEWNAWPYRPLVATVCLPSKGEAATGGDSDAKEER